MKRKQLSLPYILLTSRLDQIWLPVSFWALFALLLIILSHQGNTYELTIGYLGFALPLVAGILAAYIILDDPALELQFATPRPARVSFGQRFVIVLAAISLCALSFQVFTSLLGINLSSLGDPIWRQFAWITPSLSMMALGSVSALALAQANAGALFVGLLWIIQVLARGWFLSGRWARYFFVFMSAYAPENPALVVNQILLLGIAGVMILACIWLLRKQERYI